MGAQGLANPCGCCRLLKLFEWMDIDEDQVIDYQEVHEGLYKLNYSPPIKLSLEEYENITKGHILENDNSHALALDLIGFSTVMRNEMKLFCQRRLGNLIKYNDGKNAIQMFAFKLLLQSADQYTTPGGPGAKEWGTGMLKTLHTNTTNYK